MLSLSPLLSPSLSAFIFYTLARSVSLEFYLLCAFTVPLTQLGFSPGWGSATVILILALTFSFRLFH